MNKLDIVGFVGMSHLGIITALATAKNADKILCLDENESLIDELSKGIFNIREPHVADFFQEYCGKIRWTSDFTQLNQVNLVFITLDISTNDHGSRNDVPVLRLIEKCLENMKPGSTLVINSQVQPGTTRIFHKSANRNKIDLYYQVETLIFGEAFERAINPDRIIVGSDQQVISKIYKKYLQNFNCPILHMNFESAEFAKICINMYLISNIITTDALSSMSKEIGADWQSIQKALRLDKRIGVHSYLSPSLGINGLNLVRDFRVVQQHLNLNRLYRKYFSSIEGLSKFRRKWILSKIEELNKAYGASNVLFYGISYKKDTNSVANSPSYFAYKNLGKSFTKKYYDKNVEHLNDGSQSITNLQAALQGDLILVLTQDISMSEQQSISEHSRKGNKIYLIDPFNLCGENLLHSTIKVENLY